MKYALVVILLSLPVSAQVTSTCSLYGNTANCVSTDNGAVAAEQQREAYATGQAIGSGIGMAIFRAHFPGWRRKYCSRHPNQPFYYGNAAGDSITGTCPSQDAISNEVAAEWMARNQHYKPSEPNGKAMDIYIADNHLARWEPKTYKSAYKALLKQGKLEQ